MHVKQISVQVEFKGGTAQLPRVFYFENEKHAEEFAWASILADNVEIAKMKISNSYRHDFTKDMKHEPEKEIKN
jgi:hypothetical protein